LDRGVELVDARCRENRQGFEEGLLDGLFGFFALSLVALHETHDGGVHPLVVGGALVRALHLQLERTSYLEGVARPATLAHLLRVVGN